jgi:ABC-type transporter Mla MlaB component
MHISRIQENDKTLIQIEGDINKCDVEKLCGELKNLEKLSEFIIDLSKVQFACSSLINFLINLRLKYPSDYTKVRLLKPNTLILELLELTNVNQLYEIIGESKAACPA